MGTATLIRKNLPEFKGDARLYKLDPPMLGDDRYTIEEEYEYVIVSAVLNLGFPPETYIFPADSDGGILDWGELDGSFKGALDHERALNGAGYQIVVEVAS